MINKRIAPSPELREKVLERDNYTCRYCGSIKGPFHIDHVYPVSKGGATVEPNLVTACRRCNGKKGNKIGFWPNPSDMEEQKRRAVEENYPAGGYFVALLGFFIIMYGKLASKLFGIDFDILVTLGVIVGCFGIIDGLRGL